MIVSNIVVSFLPDVSIQDLRMVWYGLMAGLCNRPMVVSEEVYWWLVSRKFIHRVHSMDEVLRKEIPHMSEEIGGELQPPVKNYSSEGPVYVSEYRCRSHRTGTLKK